MIDPKTGEIRFPGESETFGPSLTQDAFLSLEIGKRSSIASNIHEDSFALPGIVIHGHPFYRVFYFLGGRVYQVFMGSTHPQFGNTWSDWSEEKEMARKRFHELVLATIFGTERERFDFPWGSVSSYYDVKGNHSEIAVTYIH
jgi:hypothetical protein